jgi:hypothetical protein
MAILLKVEWVERAEQFPPTDNVKHIGGSSKEFQWKHSREEAIRSIEENQFAYYIKKDAEILRLEVGMTSDGQKFLKTHADINVPTHLLNLPTQPQPKIVKYGKRQN